MNYKPILSIIIVNWKTKLFLEKCLKSVFNQTKNISFEIFVVDNGSNDGSIKMIKNNFPQVHLIANKKNLGFAKANNQAIKKSRGDYILLLNPDTIILDKAIEKCLGFIKTKPKIGILGCQILNPDRTIQFSCRRFPTLLSQIIILLKIHNFFPNLEPIRKYYMFDFDHQKEKIVDQVMGAFFLVKKDVFDKTGLLDEKYWIWFEEVDFCKRAKRAGFLTYFYPKASIIHHKAVSFNQMLGIKKQFRLNNSMLYYFKKFHSPLSVAIILFLYPISMFLAGIAQLANLFLPIKKRKEL